MKPHPVLPVGHQRATRVRRPDERGVALIVTLAILAMLTVLLVAFVSNVRTERMAGHAFTEETRARMAAQAAVEMAIYQLRTNLAAPNCITFVSNTLFDANASTNPVTMFYGPSAASWIPGTTGNPTNFLLLNTLTNKFSALTDSSASNNFNEQGFMFPARFVPNVRVPWTYMANSMSSNSTQTNRSLVRMSWYIDDDSTKININYAGNALGAGPSHMRTNDFTVGGIDLVGLPYVGPVAANSIVANRATSPYETLASVMEAPGVTYVGQYYFTNTTYEGGGVSVYGTACSSDYERQTNGTKRININSFTNVLPATDVTNMIRALGTQVLTNGSVYGMGLPVFTNKFRGDSFQICANIRDQQDADDWPTDSENNVFSTTGFLGIEHCPYLNELMLNTEVQIAIVGANYQIGVTNKVTWEYFNLWDTPCYLWTNVSTAYTSAPMTFTWAAPSPTPGTTNFPFTNPSVRIIAATNAAFSYFVTNKVQAYTFTIPTNGSPFNLTISSPASGTITNLWGTTNGAGTVFYRQDLAELPARAAYAPAALSMPGVPITWTWATNVAMHAHVGSPGDPRNNNTTANWVSAATTNNTFGAQNTTYAPGTAGGDNETTTSIATDGGFPFLNKPFPSPGFLGIVSYPTNDWKTLKLYGDGYSNYNANAKVPDWALLDIFTVNTPGSLVSGKMNINNQRDKLGNVSSAGSMFGLLAGIPLYTGTVILTNNNAFSSYVTTNLINNAPYFTIGDLATVDALTNGAPGAFGLNTDKRREAIIRALSGVTTVHGNNFTIWARGQNVTALQGKITVLGDAFIQATVERVPSYNNTTGQITNQLFNVKSYRYLSE